MKTILITGINGFLGRNLERKLSPNYRVIGLTRSMRQSYQCSSSDIHVFSDKIIKKIFEENTIDVVVHLATLYNTTAFDYSELVESNILLPVKLLSYARNFGTPVFINCDTFFNSKNNDSGYLSHYTLSKRHSLEWLRSLNKDIVLINMKIFHMYGPMDSDRKFVNWLIKEMIAGNPISLTDGEQVRDFIFVDDVVDAFEVVINHIDNMFLRFYEFEVGSGVGTKIREFVEICHYLCKTNSVLYFGSLPSRQGEDMNCISDNTQLRSLEWYPRHNIESGVHKILSSLC